MSNPASPGSSEPARSGRHLADAPRPRWRRLLRADGSRIRWWPPDRRAAAAGAGGIACLLVLGLLVGLLWGVQQFNRIETIDLEEILATGNGTNYLIVGSDTRTGIDPDDPTAGHILGPEAPAGGPERSDTILILRVDGDGARMLSVPRDLLVTIAETGSRTRINAAFNGGPTRLIATLTAELGLPIHHYLEVDFVAFRDLVDALGGIVINFEHPAFDEKSGLRIDQSGDVTLDGDQALSYVRSRYYTEIVDGEERQDFTGDLGRVARQQRFLAAVTDKIGSTRNPFRLAAITRAMVDGMRIDEGLGFTDALALLFRFRGLDPQPRSLPTEGLRHNGAAVLRLVQPDADAVLTEFGSAGATG